MKPIVLKKSGSKWELYLNMPAALAYGARGPRMEKYPHDAMVPLSKTGPKTIDFVPGGRPTKFSKGEADSYAHRVGRYMLGFGDFVSTYTEEVR